MKQIDLDNFDPEDFKEALLILPHTAIREILHFFQEALDDGYMDGEQREYYVNVLSVWTRMLDSSQEEHTHIFNYSPIKPIENPGDALGDGIIGDMWSDDDGC